MKNKNEGMTHSVVSEWENLVQKEAKDMFPMPKQELATTGAYALLNFSERQVVNQSRKIFEAGAKFASDNISKHPKVGELIDLLNILILSHWDRDDIKLRLEEIIEAFEEKAE